jgi:hypothetical protein
LAAREMSRLFTDLWPTAKAAERWLAKNPPEAYRDIIRVWGIFVDYKPKRRRRWSKALVRRGADPRLALAAVLEVAAEDIDVRQVAGSEPPAKANTAPRPRPNNPNTNEPVSPVTAG